MSGAGDGRGVAFEQLTLALADAHAINRDLVQQLGAANATIATLAVTTHKRLHPDPITVRELFERFRAAFHSHPCWNEMRNRLEAFVAFYGDRLADSLAASDWPPFREKRLGDTVRGSRAKTGRKLSKLTVNHELGWVKRMFNWGSDEEQNLVVCNPFAPVKRMKCRKNRETWITEEDAQRLLAAPAPRKERARRHLHAFLLLMLDTGLRFNEARKMRRDYVRETATSRIVVDVGRTKGGKTHLVGMTERSVEALAELEPVEGSPHFFARLRRRRGEAVETPGLFSETQMRRWFREMCAAAGIDTKVAEGDVRLRPHDIRHSAATLAHRRGASLKKISRMLNHSSVSITARYVHGEEDDAVEMAELMEDGIRREAKRAPRRRKAAHRAAPPHMVVAEKKTARS